MRLCICHTFKLDDTVGDLLSSLCPPTSRCDWCGMFTDHKPILYVYRFYGNFPAFSMPGAQESRGFLCFWSSSRGRMCFPWTDWEGNSGAILALAMVQGFASYWMFASWDSLSIHFLLLMNRYLMICMPQYAQMLRHAYNVLASYGFVVGTLRRWSGGLGLIKFKWFKSSRCFSKVPCRTCTAWSPMIGQPYSSMCFRSVKHSFWLVVPHSPT